MTSEESVILFCCGPIGNAQVKLLLKTVARKQAIKRCQMSDERASREHYFLKTEKRSERFPDAVAKMPTPVKGEAGEKEKR